MIRSSATFGIRLGMMLLLAFACGTAASGQRPTASPTPKPEEIEEDFSRSRSLGDDGPITGGSDVFTFKKPKYKQKRTVPPAKPLARHASAGKSTTKSTGSPVDRSPEIWKRLGITIWRLPKESVAAVGSGETARQMTQGFAGAEGTLQRVSADTVFARGDRVRLSFESPAAGYLYVIDREIYADGKVGEPYQIFPTMMARAGNNRVMPGSIIDIPAQSDRVPFFELKSDKPNWRGELLTIIVSPEPQTSMPMPDRPSPIDAAMVEVMEAKHLKPAIEFDQQGTAGKTNTKAETAAGDGTRQLTQGDAYPQTMYRQKVRAKEPMMMNLSLTVK